MGPCIDIKNLLLLQNISLLQKKCIIKKENIQATYTIIHYYSQVLFFISCDFVTASELCEDIGNKTIFADLKSCILSYLLK